METDTQKITKAGSKPAKLYQAMSMGKAKKIADELMKFVRANNLSANIAGKDYLLTEAWQFVGETQMGLTQVVTECEKVVTDDPKEIKYRAVVEVFNQQGTIISRGFAFCSNKESKKTKFEEYAVASMAQTRAIGKAYRNILAWIVRMAGYEATPVEEMDKDSMEKDLAKAKQSVVKAFNEAGITDSTKMIEFIKQTTGKATIETIDEAFAIIEKLTEDEDGET